MSDDGGSDGASAHRVPNEDATELERRLEEEYPNRPRNHSPTLPFHTLFRDLFNPLIENRANKPGTTIANRRKVGPNASNSVSPSERRRAIIERYIARWRRDVGNDFYPAMRLIIPDKDRERGVYGLKEKILGKLLVKIMKIDKNSEDGFNLLHWKIPSQSKSAGDFAVRCYEVISKRPMRIEVGDMTIEEVNELLDKLSAAPREEHQLPILTEFYKRMNAEELMWLIRIILRQMKVGATEKTFFHIFHPDAETLFNVSSNLRRVCWELYDPSIRLEGDEAGVMLMECFQPQLAQYNMESLQKIVQRMRPTEEDDEFWIEEKLDGERMQLHMITDDSIEGGRRFQFWSRKAKDYTYLYGKGFYDREGALTQFIKDAFRPDVENIILDGEMITWDPEQDAPVPFGTLKTAALAEQRNPFAGGQRPLFRVFDILLLNGQNLTRYTLRDRRKALEASVKSVPRRIELHEYKVGRTVEDVENCLREVVAQASEGLMLKNPRSAYRLDDRNGDWQKVKPEYMTGLGESFDCLIIGAFYGSGRRGGKLSSFLCGLRAPANYKSPFQSQNRRQSQVQSQSQSQAQPEGDEPSQKFVSFFKVGGGMTANDYATIQHETDGKWLDWDPKRPPTQYIELGGGSSVQKERPDVWIKPEDSLVIEVKAAQVTASEDYACGMTLRFPRFKKLRRDKDWRTALSLEEFKDLRDNIEKEQEQKMEVDDAKKKQRKGNAPARKKMITVAGYNAKAVNNATLPDGPRGKVFEGLTFYIMTESTAPAPKKSKLELEALVKANGGRIVQTHTVVPDTICVATRRTVKVASLQKQNNKEIVRPLWIFDCIEQAKKDFAKGYPEMVLPLEPERHLFFVPDEMKDRYADNVDQYGDSFARDTSVDELSRCMDQMGDIQTANENDIHDLFPDYLDMKGYMFYGLVFFFDQPELKADRSSKQTDTRSESELTNIDDLELIKTRNIALFAGAEVLPKQGAPSEVSLATLPEKQKLTITHIIAHPASDLPELRKTVARWKSRKIPHIVSAEWLRTCWQEGTRVDEDAYVAR
ncbi:DNA ligase (ATP) [Exophiala dermatitidis]|uniref:DNA ligase n=2 Tax=Exophiala dermatitidis TaxID=5970 RepID=H6BN77_EXODN|nr:DNA ligase 4 [Exophiala dermatitidis NIH/UT8656]KAJ4512058.1 DNA ligase (ATP) [Exophiala dermatitidis]EHY53145.1 DNA ligase 4 [Exophiala dermatitidis NIH/UT8656]KAJ4514943.1 DNA ligase (ATP) [Exophiala dermatitidis]KAJ4517434.1 DNA ligase (ATP) [Exophiala dermatitidis]KAJ4548813.1 DNA ligase (ATP) [Exophiala dermatitidis]